MLCDIEDRIINLRGLRSHFYWVSSSAGQLVDPTIGPSVPYERKHMLEWENELIYYIDELDKFYTAVEGEYDDLDNDRKEQVDDELKYMKDRLDRERIGLRTE